MKRQDLPSAWGKQLSYKEIKLGVELSYQELPVKVREKDASTGFSKKEQKKT